MELGTDSDNHHQQQQIGDAYAHHHQEYDSYDEEFPSMNDNEDGNTKFEGVEDHHFDQFMDGDIDVLDIWGGDFE